MIKSHLLYQLSYAPKTLSFQRVKEYDLPVLTTLAPLAYRGVDITPNFRLVESKRPKVLILSQFGQRRPHFSISAISGFQHSWL